MKSSFYDDIHILGMDFAPGNLIVVGGEHWDMMHYVQANCIMEGTMASPGMDVPMLYFSEGNFVQDAMLRLVTEMAKDKDGNIDIDNKVRLPSVYFDNTPSPSMSYLVGRIFHMVETVEIGGVVIDTLQNVTGGPLKRYRREHQLNCTLSILKKVAEITDTVIIVLSSLTYPRRKRRLSVDDLLESPYVEAYCDQIILLDHCNDDLYELILIKGTPGNNQVNKTVIKARLRSKNQPFRRAQ